MVVSTYNIGLTGVMGAGKSFVEKVLRELGISVLDADQVVHQLYASDHALIQAIAQCFGAHVLIDGCIDRKALGAIVFTDETRRQELNALVHPKVRKAIETFLNQPDQGIQVVSVPLLLENGAHQLVDEVWVVRTEESVLMDRLMTRDQVSLEQLRQRLATQWPQDKKVAYADVVIDNSGTRDETARQIHQHVKAVQERDTSS